MIATGSGAGVADCRSWPSFTILSPFFAREFIAPELHPWENKQRDPTPQQVRRGLAKFLLQLGTSASPPKPRGNPKGRKKGTVVRKATRFPVVRKTAKVPQIVPT